MTAGTTRVLKSAARWLQRRAKSKSGADTKQAYREAIKLIQQLSARSEQHARSTRGTTPDGK
jgi:hypothetical protein